MAWISVVGLSATLASSAAPAVRAVRPQPDLGGGGQSDRAATPTDDGTREFTISGCLVRNGYAGYQIDDARVDAIDGKPVEEDSSKSSSMPRKWILEGGGNLGADTGKKLQVTGRSDWQPPSPDEPPNRIPHLAVKSVKTVAPTCS